MKRVLLGALLVTAVGLSFAACDGGGDYVTLGANCAAFTSCDTCTPVLGCGWCTAPGGGGVCASDPDYCPTQEFSWTWDKAGCRVAADASVGPLDDARAPEASVQDSPSSRDGAPRDTSPGADASGG